MGIMLLVEPNGMDLFVATADQLGLFDDRPKDIEESEDYASDVYNFWTLREKITRNDPENVLIGWKIGEDEERYGFGAPGEWEINPKDKEHRFVLTSSRLLAILKCKAPEKRMGNM